MKTILVPVDFSGATASVVAAAIGMAKAYGARIVLIHAVRPPAVVNEYAPEEAELARVAEQEAAQRLDPLAGEIGAQGVEAEAIGTYGHPVPIILDEARRLDAACIVMGSHGHTGFYDLLIGSTTSGVLKRSPCPVVIVPARKKARRR